MDFLFTLQIPDQHFCACDVFKKTDDFKKEFVFPPMHKLTKMTINFST